MWGFTWNSFHVFLYCSHQMSPQNRTGDYLSHQLPGIEFILINVITMLLKCVQKCVCVCGMREKERERWQSCQWITQAYTANSSVLNEHLQTCILMCWLLIIIIIIFCGGLVWVVVWALLFGMELCGLQKYNICVYCICISTFCSVSKKLWSAAVNEHHAAQPPLIHPLLLL